MLSLISIVVPVYQVEPYLKRSVESILRQTYQNIEIILVSDFASDRCGRICDDFAKKDQRVKVIHKEHGGLSAARNAGLDIVSGEYIGFVDSDDWIEPDMYEYLINGIKKTNADISICSFWEEHPYKNKIIGSKVNILLNRSEAIRALITTDGITNTVWNKLYRRSLFDKIRFPEGRLSEDSATTYRMFARADTICILANPKYHYFINPKGLMREKNLNRELDFWMAAKQRYYDLLPFYPELEEPLKVDIMQAIMNIWSMMWDLDRTEWHDHADLLNEMAEYAKSYCGCALRWCHFGITGKICTVLTQYNSTWSFWLCHILKMLSDIRCGG